MTIEQKAAHRINGVTELADTGFNALELRLSEAHGLLSIIGAAIYDSGGNQVETPFGDQNRDIQGSAIDAVRHLIAEAHWHAHEAFNARKVEGAQ